MNIVLIHGGWQGGWAWDGVAAQLRDKGHTVYAPTLPGCGLHDSDQERAQTTLSGGARSVIDELRKNKVTELVVVGHSGGGPVGQLVAAAFADIVKRVVFIDAWALKTGESIFDVIPPAMGSFRDVAAGRSDKSIPMDPVLWHQAFMNDATDEQAATIANKLVPNPIGWLDEKPNFDAFWHQHIPAAYIFMADDHAVDQSIYHTMAARLENPITTTIPGSHEVMLVHPDVLADAILKVSLPLSPAHM